MRLRQRYATLRYIRCELDTGTRHFGKFGINPIPVVARYGHIMTSSHGLCGADGTHTAAVHIWSLASFRIQECYSARTSDPTNTTVDTTPQPPRVRRLEKVAEYVVHARRWASSRRRAGATARCEQTSCRGKSIDYLYDTLQAQYSRAVARVEYATQEHTAAASKVAAADSLLLYSVLTGAASCCCCCCC